LTLALPRFGHFALEAPELDLGCDGVIMHGATPEQLAPVVDAYRTIRPTGTFDHLAANPGA